MILRIFCFLFFIYLIYACAKEVSPDLKKENNTAVAYRPTLVFPPDLSIMGPNIKSVVGVNCEAAKISTLAFKFTLNEVSYGPHAFECNDHGAVISDVPVGADVRVDVYVYNQKDQQMLHGAEVTDIVEGQVNDGGRIQLVYTAPYIQYPDGYSADYTNDFGMGFNFIEAGSFTMGSPVNDPNIEDDEMPYEATLTQNYFMQTTEVTQAQWIAVMGDNPSYFTACGPNCPVESVDWEKAAEFVEKLNDLDDGPCTYRLPTEAQWEYAARADTDTSFAGGNIANPSATCHSDPVLDDMGWYCGNARVYYDGCIDTRDRLGRFLECSGTNPVAQKEPNSWGLFDMHGNVFEWCLDWYASAYPLVPETDPDGPDRGDHRVMRSGGFLEWVEGCRSASRYHQNPMLDFYDVGLRVVCLPIDG